MFFGKKREAVRETVNSRGKIPVIRASICTGERVAGFQDPQTKRFEDVMLIRDDGDLESFCRTYHLKAEEIKTIY